MISADEEPAENVKMKRIIKKFSEKKNSDTMMFEIVDVKNSNARIFIKHHIDDTTSISNSFMKFYFEFEDFLKEEGAAQAGSQKKKKSLKKNENESFEKTKKKKTDE